MALFDVLRCLSTVDKCVRSVYEITIILPMLLKEEAVSRQDRILSAEVVFSVAWWKIKNLISLNLTNKDLRVDLY